MCSDPMSFAMLLSSISSCMAFIGERGGNVLDERGVPDLGGSSQLDLHLNGFGGGRGGVVDNGVPVDPDARLAVHLEGGLGALEDHGKDGVVPVVPEGVKDGRLVRDLTFGDCLDLQVEAEAFSQGHLKGFPW